MNNISGLLMLALLMLCAVARAENSQELVARYSFDEGSGPVLHDRSGNGHNGNIVGAKWVEEGGHPALRFSGQGDYVDFGNDRGLKLAGDSTILAWVRLEASPYPDDRTNWGLVDCEDYGKEGFILRVDGAACKVMYRVNHEGGEQYGFGTKTIANGAVIFIGVVRQGETATVYVDGIVDVQIPVKPPILGAVPFRISSTGQSFSGLMYEVIVFGRALDSNEIAEAYWRGVARYDKEAVQRGQLRISPFVYCDDREALADVDFFGILPLAEGERVLVELARRGGEAVASKEIAVVPEKAKGEYGFSLEGLSDGEYELRAVLKGRDRSTQASAPFHYPSAPIIAPSPDSLVIDPLPVDAPAPTCTVKIPPGGGVVMGVAGRTIPIESSFSFPHKGVNALVCTDNASKDGEPEWQVTGKGIDESTWQIDACGKHYALLRKVAVQRGRVLFSDTIRNLTSDALGIMLTNQVGVERQADTKVYLGGKETARPTDDCRLLDSPTIFVSAPGFGIGIIPLDDVYIVQSRAAFDDHSVSLLSKEFALAAGASYTLEWAVYANATGDYYDFVNAVRRDEGRNNVTIEGGFAFIPGSQRKREASLVPAARYFEMRNVRYSSLYCLSWCTDDPAISVEGIEFIEYPQERRQVRAMMDSIASVWPRAKGMFHVAHKLYATNRPDEHFPDSRLIGADGRQTVYPNNYMNSAYFSRERAEQNWRWWIYYPTLDNSFGKALLASVDVMMDEMGAQGVFVDGFMWGYGGDYTYDRWDGHSAEIDPETKTIKRKLGSMMLMTQDAMIAYCRKVWDKGGVVVANGVIPTRTVCALPLIVDREMNEGPQVHLVPTPVTLGNSVTLHSELDVYQDVRNKLRWGNLYFYYGEPETLTYESVPKEMYPITVQEVHSGYIKGKERLVTMNSGVYGWANSRDLHLAHRYDARGHRIRPGFVTAVDATSVRTRIDLGDNETAVLVRVRVRMEAAGSVNVVVERYDDQGIVMNVNGKGRVTVTMPDGKAQECNLDGPREIRMPAN